MTVTFGAELAKSVPCVPSAHVLGIDERFVAYDAQSGIGTAGPTQLIVWTPVGSPVLSIAVPSRPELALFANTPTPPRHTARGARNAPVNAAISFDWPSVFENPMRGLSTNGVGMRSLRRPNTRSTFELKSGIVVKWLASTRRLY